MADMAEMKGVDRDGRMAQLAEIVVLLKFVDFLEIRR